MLSHRRVKYQFQILHNLSYTKITRLVDLRCILSNLQIFSDFMMPTGGAR
jgi:hypothetical protein